MADFPLVYEFAPDYMERRANLRDGHLALLLFQGDTRGAAEAFARADPHVTQRLVERWSVRPWTTVDGRDATTPCAEPHFRSLGASA